MSSPSASDGPAPPSNRRFSRSSKRGVRSHLHSKLQMLTVPEQKLRNGTFILPGTGERVRRQITLRNPSNFDGPLRNSSNGEHHPLSPNSTSGGRFQKVIPYVRVQWEEFGK